MRSVIAAASIGVVMTLVTGCAGDGAPASPTTAMASSVRIPDVVGMSPKDARTALEDAGLKSTVAGQGSLIVGQRPAAGGEARLGYAIQLDRGLSAQEKAAEDAAEAAATAAKAEKLAAAAAESAANAAAALAAQHEAKLCAPFRADLANPTWSPVNIAFHAVRKQSVFLPSSGTSMPLTDFTAACPEFAPFFGDMQARVNAGEVFDAGTYAVGTDIAAGTYVTAGTSAKDCYWSRTTSSGDIVDNDFVGFAPGVITITVKAGEGLEVNEHCGIWVRQ
ncbi:PASTA domain-containing protein [Cellulomonas sp. URHB0016]